MAGSRFAYVRDFELPDPLLPDTYIVLRIDGHSFHRQSKTCPWRPSHGLTFHFYRFSEDHGFAKPNDVRALQLMDEAAGSVMQSFPDITLAFGESDEFRRVDLDLNNKTPAAEERLPDQLFVQKIHQRLQETTRQDIDNGRISIHVFLCVPLGEAFPGGELEVPSVVRW